MAKSKISAVYIYLSLIFLAIPDFAIIDIFPDLIAYIVFAKLISDVKDIVPHLEEAHTGLKRLTIISLIKIPATLFMLSNMALGRDIITLMTLAFSAIELIALIPTIKEGFAGLYYIGERTKIDAILSPVRLGDYTLRCESIEGICYAFFGIKLGLNTVSQMFLLSSSSELITLKLRQIYPIITILSLALTLICGIIFLIITTRYFSNIEKERTLYDEILGLMTREQERSINHNKRLASLIKPLDLFIIAQIFMLDFTLKNVGEFNLLPRFIFPILVFIVAYRLFDRNWQMVNFFSCTAYTLIGIFEYFLSIDFYSRFTSVDLASDEAAKAAYRVVMSLNVIELILVIPMLLLFFIGIRKFIKKNTAVTPDSDKYGKLDREIHGKLAGYFAVILTGDFIISALKCLNALLKSDVSPLFTDAMDTLVAVSSAPWLSALISGISILLIFISYYLVGLVKDEVKLKLND